MIKVLFLIHDLGQGGAEKVLVNLVNNMDRDKFDITVMSLFGGGVNEQFLREHIRYRAIFPKAFPGNSHVMKILSPKALHRLFIKNTFDVEVSYLEGPAARVISGCPYKETRLISWIHVEQHTREIAAKAFRSYKESVRCYGRFDQTVCVSEYVKQDFQSIYPELQNMRVLYNTNETDQILERGNEAVDDGVFLPDEIRVCGVGKLMPIKGFDKILRIHKRLRDEGYPIHTYVLGEGPERRKLEEYIRENGLKDSATLLGYQTNPYKYLAKCNLFVCASIAEGFSTAATEALVLGVPVCTVDVSGMKEMLGENDEYGIVTENSEEALCQGIKRLLDDPELLAHYKMAAGKRGKRFSKASTVKAVEGLLSGSER